MTRYVDGFILPIPKKNVAAYRKMAEKGAKIWREHGALEYYECLLEDANPQFGVPFPRGVQTKRGETVIFAWIVYKSRAHRDRVNAKVEKDPRMTEGMDPKRMPFDMKRILYGGFEVLVADP